MGESFSCQMSPTTWSLAKWLKEREPENCKERQKGRLIWRKVLLFYFGGLQGFWGVCECRGGVLSDYSMALTTAETINSVWPCVTHWQGQRVHQILMCFPEKEAGIFFFFYFQMISVNKKDSNCFHSPVLELKGFIWNGAAFVSPRPIPNPAGKWWNFIHFIHLEGGSQLHWVSFRY